jgi:hypothetical protein
MRGSIQGDGNNPGSSRELGVVADFRRGLIAKRYVKGTKWVSEYRGTFRPCIQT